MPIDSNRKKSTFGIVENAFLLYACKSILSLPGWEPHRKYTRHVLALSTHVHPIATLGRSLNLS